MSCEHYRTYKQPGRSTLHTITAQNRRISRYNQQVKDDKYYTGNAIYKKWSQITFVKILDKLHCTTEAARSNIRYIADGCNSDASEEDRQNNRNKLCKREPGVHISENVGQEANTYND